MNAALPSQPTDLASALADVRHAYRIVAAYQQRLFFLLRQIEAGFPELHFAYWEPAEYARPPQGRTTPWTKWCWDFLPYYSSLNFLTQDGVPIGQKLDIGEWFIMVKFFTDSGFNNEIETTPSFSGPDPLKMPPVEETETMIYVSLYQVIGRDGKGKTPGEIVHTDTSEDWEYLVWHEIPAIGARCLTTGGNLAGYLEAGAMEQTISEFLERLIEEGILQDSAKNPVKTSVNRRK
ncbi:hypothetical protein ACFOMH_16570 [Paracoccus mangrovi]|uniref:Immunity protein 52 domain-containing protein n=1 Tax=Paracoccus mangrovi TaxID=1715645 RepID=A0ABV7R6I6_9RHOB